MEIKMVIVDDIPENIRIIKGVIDEYNSYNSDICFYIIEIFSGQYAFIEAQEYIKVFQNEIDILLIDYHLLVGTAIDLFNEINRYNKIYRILHSITHKTLPKALEHHRKYWDGWCKSVDTTTIKNALEQYKNINAIKSGGNPLIVKKYSINLENARRNEHNKNRFGGIIMEDILYAKFHKEKGMSAYYRDYQSHSIKLVTRTNYRLTDLMLCTDAFKKINNEIAINLLWVANFDLNEKRIEFITMQNRRYEIFFRPSVLYSLRLKKHLREVSLLPEFFRS